MCNSALSPIACTAKDALGDGANKVAGNAGESAMEGVANFFNEAAEWAVKNLTSAWLNAPSPDVRSSASVSAWLGERLSYFVAAVMVGSFLLAAYRLATQPRAEHLRDLGESLVRVLLATTVAALLITSGVQVGEIFSDWILAQADVDLTSSVLTAIPNPGFLLVLAVVMLLAQVIQVVLMLARNAMIIYLAAVLPLAAAGSTTASGKQWWSKSIAWLIAFVLYKPVAALIYAGAFKLLSDERSITDQITGVLAVVLAIFALPAMMRFLVPATASMATGNAGAMALGMVGAAVATGAVVASGGAAGAGFSGGASSAPVGAGASGGGAGVAPTGPSGAPSARGGSSPAGPGAERASGAISPRGSGSDGENGSSSSGDAATGTPQAPTGGHPGPEGAGAPVSGGGSSGSSWQSAADAARLGSQTARRSSDGASGAVGEDHP